METLGQRAQNITVRSLKVNANSDENGEKPHGKDFFNIIHCIDCDSVSVHDRAFHDSLGDETRVKTFINMNLLKLGRSENS